MHSHVFWTWKLNDFLFSPWNNLILLRLSMQNWCLWTALACVNYLYILCSGAPTAWTDSCRPTTWRRLSTSWSASRSKNQSSSRMSGRPSLFSYCFCTLYLSYPPSSLSISFLFLSFYQLVYLSVFSLSLSLNYDFIQFLSFVLLTTGKWRRPSTLNREPRITIRNQVVESQGCKKMIFF